MTVVIGAFAAIVLFGMIVAGQLGSLAENLPLYQRNIETKMQSIKDANLGEGLYKRVSKLFERLGHQIQEDQPPAPGEVVASDEPPPASSTSGPRGRSRASTVCKCSRQSSGRCSNRLRLGES